MTRLSLFGLLAAGLTLLAGCPIFDDNPNQSCENCGTGGGPTTSSGQCFAQADCTGVNETCGSDGFCHTGDCVSWGCVNGEMCSVGADQKAHCGPGGAGGAGGASMGGAGGSGGAIIAGGAGGAGGTGGASMGGTGGAGGAAQGGAGGAGGATGGAAQGGAAQGGAPSGGAGGAPAGGAGGTGGM